MNKIKSLVSAAALHSSNTSRLTKNAISSNNSIPKFSMNFAKHCHAGAEAEKEKEFAIQDKDLESEENIRDFYERWMKYHGVFRPQEEIPWRLKIFADKIKYIHNHNTSGLHRFTLGPNRFTDWTPEESKWMGSIYCGQQFSKQLKADKAAKRAAESASSASV